MGARTLCVLLVLVLLCSLVQCLVPGERMDLGSAAGVEWLIAKEATLPGRVDGTVLTNTTAWDIYPFPRPLSQLPWNITDCEHACDVRPFWTPATVPGTVLGALVASGQEPHPYQSFNNELIPDIYDVGPEEYTYWFYANFTLTPEDGVRYWLELRGINYAADVYVNGRRSINNTLEGMFKRHSIDVTNRLNRTIDLQQIAILVEPPFPPGNATVGQCGDGTIAKSVTCQYMAGWDWIISTRDRSTGPWDKVQLLATRDLRIEAPSVLVTVPEARDPSTPPSSQAPVDLSVATDVTNSSPEPLTATVCWALVNAGHGECLEVVVPALQTSSVRFSNVSVENPSLWWPNGLGAQPLYTIQWNATVDGLLTDSHLERIGLREIRFDVDDQNGGRRFWVNGNKVFIRGANWIGLDAMMRVEKDGPVGHSWYADEVRMHAEMGFNMIRVWGGGTTERPEFYDACDENGILVWQEFWITGDCNGKWNDTLKRQTQARRRAYPNSHQIFLDCAEDAIKMLRNHPSLCLWVGGNEYPPPEDIDIRLRAMLLELDPLRLYLPDSLSGGVGTHKDGPYGIQDPRWFFVNRDLSAFNPEVGSVGVPTAETMRSMLSPMELEPFGAANPAWVYHKMKDYATDSAGTHKNATLPDQIGGYGEPTTLEEYCSTAQVVNYVQYRALLEGRNNRMWDWYTGVLVWKSQNPWLGLRGQFYDWLGEQTGGFYGAKKALEEVHVQLSLGREEVDDEPNSIVVVNHSLLPLEQDTVVRATFYDIVDSNRRLGNSTVFCNETLPLLDPNSIYPACTFPTNETNAVRFLNLELTSSSGALLSQNLYWLSTTNNLGLLVGQGRQFEVLRELEEPSFSASIVDSGVVGSLQVLEVSLANLDTDGRVALWMRLQVLEKNTDQRVLPVFYSDNYVTLLAGQSQNITLTFTAPAEGYKVVVSGWNVPYQVITSSTM